MEGRRNGRSSGRSWIAMCLFLAAAGFYLWTEHRAHLLGAMPWVLLLACPAVHLFMHHGHGGPYSEG